MWWQQHRRKLDEHNQLLATRESQVRVRESTAAEHDTELKRREHAMQLREEALRALSEADAARVVREHLMVQMREANERLVLATIRADELVERAVAAHALAAETVAVEAERRRHAEELTTQLRASEDALRARERSAQASNRAKNEFLAMLGHELRAPLSPILLALELIAMDGKDTHKREHTIIERQMKQLVRLVDDLFDLSRIRTGKIELRRQRLELAEVVARAVETVGPLITAKGHTLSIEVPEVGLETDGDVLRLTQVVSNLLTNAAKYTPSGGSIVIKGQLNGPNVQLRVRDNGIGISEKMLPRVFDLFVQEHQSAEREAPGGLGLGLSIVRALVAMHGGTITAHSEGLGSGSEFVVELPSCSLPGKTAIATDATPRRGNVTPRKILVVDDNYLVADLMNDALSRLGHEVRMAFDGASAVSSAGDFQPDVVLLDIGMPGMDGYEAAQLVRDALSPRPVQFIAISGHGLDSDRRRSAEAGFSDHLVKPVELATLQRSIDRSMSRT